MRYPLTAKQPNATARAALWRCSDLGIGENTRLLADDIELGRDGPTYTIDTLREIRVQIGDSTPLYLCIGMDVLATLDSWRDWQKLTDYCHLVVSSRPGYQIPEIRAIGRVDKRATL